MQGKFLSQNLCFKINLNNWWGYFTKKTQVSTNLKLEKHNFKSQVIKFRDATTFKGNFKPL